MKEKEKTSLNSLATNLNKEKKNSKSLSVINDSFDYASLQRKRSSNLKRGSNSNNSLCFLSKNFFIEDDNENSREIIQDLHKLQNKVNNLIK